MVRAIPLILLTVCQLSAATLRGVVQANELSGPPMANVKVNAGGGNQDVTKVGGDFTLSSPNWKVGQAVHLTIDLPGYVVVNEFQLEKVFVPADPEANPLIILVCKTAAYEEMARRYFRLKGNGVTEARFRAQRRELEQSGRATAAELAKLALERDQAKEAAANLADQLAKTRLGDASEPYREAMRYFLDGKVDRALQVLDDANLHAMATTAKGQSRDTTKAYLLRAQLLTSQLRFEEAESAYRAAIEIAPGDFYANFSFGVFSDALDHYSAARRAYAQAEAIAHQDENSEELAAVLNNIGNLSKNENRMPEARQALEESLRIRRGLARNNPDAYLPDVATTLNNVGILNRAENRMPEAHQALEESLTIRRELARKNSDAYLPDLAAALNSLGNLDREEYRMQEARNAYVEALGIERELARKNPDEYLPYVASTLNNFGNLNSIEKRMPEARKALEDSLEIRRELARKNPDVYLPDLASTLNSLGILNSKEDRRKEARKDYEEALAIERDLASKNLDAYLPRVAGTLHNLGVLDIDESRRDEARKALEEALAIERELVRRNPDAYLPSVADTLFELGSLDRVENRIDEARKAYEEALVIYKEFEKHNPGRYQSWVDLLKSKLDSLK